MLPVRTLLTVNPHKGLMKDNGKHQFAPDGLRRLVGTSSLRRTDFEMRQAQANLASPPVGQGGLPRLQGEHTSETDLVQEEKGGEKQASADIGHCDALGSSGRNRKNIPSQSHLQLHLHTAPYPALFGGHYARDGYIGGRHLHQLGHSSPLTSVVYKTRIGPSSH